MGNATGYRLLFFQRNNVQSIAAEMDNAVTNTTVAHHQALSTLFELSAGDFVELEVQQSSGGPLNIIASDASTPEFSMAWVGPAS